MWPSRVCASAYQVSEDVRYPAVCIGRLNLTVISSVDLQILVNVLLILYVNRRWVPV